MTDEKEMLVPNEEQVNKNEDKEKSFGEQIDDYFAGRLNRYDALKVCDTPAILLAAGCEQKPMLYTQQHLKKAVLPKDLKKHQHGLTTDFIKCVPEMLSNPVMILDSTTRDDSLVVVLSSKETDVDNCPIVATVCSNGSGTYELQTVDSNFITSLYGRENFGDFIQYCAEQNKILYYDEKKSQELFSMLGLQFSEGLNNLDPNIIIHQSSNIVKQNQKNNSEKNCFNDGMTMTQMLDRYSELEGKIRYINYDKISDSDREVLKEYADIKMLITDMSKSVDFLSNSTAVMIEDDGSIAIRSMISKDDYVKNLDVLTNGFDKDFIRAIQSEQYKSAPYDEHSERLHITNGVRESVISTAAISLAIEQEIEKENYEITVGDVRKSLEDAEKLMLENGVGKEDVFEETIKQFNKMYDENKLEVIGRIEEINVDKTEKPVTIVESNDGYVMNTSEKLSAENSKDFSNKNNIKNVNEVCHDLPKETTNNIADVRPNVRLEQVNDIGSKEQAEIDSGYGTDNDIEIAARISGVYESQTDNADTKRRNKEKCGIEH